MTLAKTIPLYSESPEVAKMIGEMLKESLAPITGYPITGAVLNGNNICYYFWCGYLDRELCWN